MAELITVPCFQFEQGDLFVDTDCEKPITVKYWQGSIELEQGGNSVLIVPAYLDKLFKEIKKHKAEAEEKLKKDFK